MTDVVIARDGAVLSIGLDRPGKKNALTQAMYRAIAEAIGAAEADPGIRVTLIHGSGDVFTAGNDLADFAADPPRREASHVGAFLQAISHTTKPLVAAVDGPAVGVGTTMLLHCDLVYAAETARFQLPFVSLGLCPEAASSFLLPRVAGYQRAAELFLLGEPFDADKAKACGFVTEIVPRAELMRVARAAANALASQPPAAVRLTKALMKRSLTAGIDRALEEEIGHFVARLHSPEAKEAFAAFFEKRKPDFSQFE